MFVRDYPEIFTSNFPVSSWVRPHGGDIRGGCGLGCRSSDDTFDRGRTGLRSELATELSRGGTRCDLPELLSSCRPATAWSLFVEDDVFDIITRDECTSVLSM